MRTRLAVLCGVLFLSGISALIFETLWLRLSGLAFGNSVWAASLILSSFMAGLALGNAIAASARVRRWRPLYFYAALEVAVAFFGCTIVFGLPGLGEWLRPLWQTLWDHQPALISLRFVLSFLILLVPTTAMGLTLPVLTEDPALGRTEFGRAIGLLYGFNTLGAVAGALAGELYLVAAFGIRGTSLIAALSNCAAAGIALLVPTRDQRSGAATALQPKILPLQSAERYRLPWRLLCVSFGTGCILLCLEVIWFRFLRLYVASSPTAFAIMVAVVLVGIALGGIVAGAVHRRSAPRNYFLPLLLLLAAILTLLSYIFFPGELIQGQTELLELKWWHIALMSTALMFPVAMISGILFPSVIAEVQATVADRMNSTGVTTLFNTAGAAAGPIVASFVLLPVVGYQWALICCATGYALLSLLVSRVAWSKFSGIGLMVGTLWAAMILTLAMFPYRRAEAHFAHASHPFEVDDRGDVQAHVVKRIEGTADTWQLVRRDLFGQPYYDRLLANAFSMSATNPYGQRYMRLFAYLPLAFRPQSEDVLLICYGCGVTADALLRGPHVKRMDVVDISKEVFALADFYSNSDSSNPLRDSRVHAVVQDGRFFLQASPHQYDVISGEPPPPKVAGSVNLYTQEFFALMNSRLKEGGIASFWLPVDQLKVEEAKAILRAFHNAFANSSVWASANRDWIMMGIKGSGRKMAEEEIRRWWSEPATGTDLRRIGLEVPQQLGALFLMDGEEMARATGDVPPLIDNYPKRLTDEPWDEEANHRFAFTYMEAGAAWQRFRSSSLIDSIWPETLETSLDSFFALRQSRYVSQAIGSNKLAELDLYFRYSRLRMPVLEVLGSDGVRVAIAERVARKSDLPPIEILPDLIAGALAARDTGRAIQLLEMKNARGVGRRDDLLLLIYLYCLAGSVEKAEQLAATNAAALQTDALAEWLWQKLQNDFGFHPPG